MIHFTGRAVLLDIEGTTSSVRYVYDVLFPFARARFDEYLLTHWGEPAVRRTCEFVVRDMPEGAKAEWARVQDDPDAARGLIVAECERLMDGDVKATGLKELQGLVWQDGYDAGLLRSHVYDDVPPALRAWNARGLDVRIYSSGSVAAQRVFFANTDFGDLRPLFRGHYDTTTGPKRSADSYRAIVADIGVPAGEVLFLSDVVAELDAAAEAGLRTGLVVRPGNASAPEGHGHPVVTSFAEVDVG